jgi:prepilin peptidase CpaA
MSTVLACAMLYASVSDYRSHRVPNWLNAGLAVSGILFNSFFGGGLAMSVLGLATGFAVLFPLWGLRMMGAGDVKYMAGLGAWMGPQFTLYAFCIGGILGGLWAITMIVRRGAWSRTSTNLGVVMLKMGSLKNAFSEMGSFNSLSGKAGVLPYAVPLSIGTGCVLILEQIGWWVS